MAISGDFYYFQRELFQRLFYRLLESPRRQIGPCHTAACKLIDKEAKPFSLRRYGLHYNQQRNDCRSPHPATSRIFLWWIVYESISKHSWSASTSGRPHIRSIQYYIISWPRGITVTLWYHLPTYLYLQVKLIWDSKWSPVKVLYFIIRYFIVVYFM